MWLPIWSTNSNYIQLGSSDSASCCVYIKRPRTFVLQIKIVNYYPSAACEHGLTLVHAQPPPSPEKLKLCILLCVIHKTWILETKSYSCKSSHKACQYLSESQILCQNSRVLIARKKFLRCTYKNQYLLTPSSINLRKLKEVGNCTNKRNYIKEQAS